MSANKDADIYEDHTVDEHQNNNRTDKPVSPADIDLLPQGRHKSPGAIGVAGAGPNPTAHISTSDKREATPDKNNAD